MRMLLALPLLCLPVTALQADDLVYPPPVVTVLPAGPDYVRTNLSGRVVEVGEETITIKPEGNPKTEEWTSFHPDGTIKEKRIYLLDDLKEPQTFVFTTSLLVKNGKNLWQIPPARRMGGISSHCGEHKISDLQCGDRVFISCRRVQGIDYCTAIHIRRRPGGLVPPAVDDENTTHKHRVDVRMNAEQAREEMLIATFRRLKVLAR